jgi:nucleoside 2-deoxyribosyltransferase
MKNIDVQRHKTIYLAGPLGFSEIGRLGIAAIAGILAEKGYEVIDPFALTQQAEIDAVLALPTLDAQRDVWRTMNVRIGETNRRAIDACDALLAILDGQDVDSGTAAEIGYAFAKGKPIVGYRGDFRLAADNIGSIINLQVEYFITASGGEIVATIAAITPALANALLATARAPG